MSDTVFYYKKNKGNVRKIVIRGATLIGAKTNKRVRLPITMGLSTQKRTSTPEWIITAHDYVGKTGDSSHPTIKFKGFDISFATENQNLFDEGTLAAAKCEMKGFVIREAGTGDVKDVVMDFTVIAQFSTRLWEFVGQNAGDDIQASFVQGEYDEEEDDQEELDLADDEDESEDEDSDEDEEE